ncbi:MAG: T9SS type A sorting domain-containing protein [Saprospiraceae bacterium]
MRSLLTLFFVIFSLSLSAQLSEACKLQFGTNLSGLVDYGTELPFVDLMHNAREWYTKDNGNPADPFDSGHADDLSYRPDGYPTHVPQTIGNAIYDQRVVTIWAITDGWPVGEYTVLWEGTGELSFWGGYDNLQQTNSNRITFDFLNPIDNVLEMTIVASDINDPIHNIRVLMPGTEMTYETEPFHSLWVEKMSIFPSVRFMDWGTTNSWGQPNNGSWDDPSLFAWEDRAQMDHYTWATNKGIPYEMMIKLLNDFDLDGWVCVPHRANDEYIQAMAELFRDNLETERHLTVEYSNEIWNWIFGQTQWLNKYGCELQNTSWPEGVVPYVQNCLDIWSTVFEQEMDRITRAAGVQVSWQDVSNRMVNNLTTGSFDAIAPTFYFGLTEDGDAALDNLGENATVTDVAFYARQGMAETKNWLRTQKEELATPLAVPMVFYEGGQHITAHPFGVEPTYAQALLDIQRDTAMYNMYNEWFDFLRTLQEGEEPLQLMNFSFVAGRSARYGSWGILETMDQDTVLTPAPKYAAILAAIEGCALSVSTAPSIELAEAYEVFPNPTDGFLTITGALAKAEITVINNIGQVVLHQQADGNHTKLSVEGLGEGIYTLQIRNGKKQTVKKLVVIQKQN